MRRPWLRDDSLTVDAGTATFVGVSRKRRLLNLLRGRRTRVLLVLALVAGVLGVIELNASADSQTASQDTLRTGWDRQEPTLTPGAITSSNFGQLFATQLNGQVYAQPLVLGDTVVASTENDWVYGLDAVTGAIRWSKNFGPAWPSATIGCADLAPNIGSTATGVYDPASNLVYLTTKVNDGPDVQHPNWYLHAVNATTGAEQAGWPVKIVGTPANDPGHPFRGYDVNQRPGLLLMNGAIYMAFGSQCDYGTYVGWVAGVNINTRAVDLWSDEVGATSTGSGIWHAGGGLMSDGPGRFFVASGNGVTAPNGPGQPVPQQLSQSVVRLGVGGDGTISAQDFFSPWHGATRRSTAARAATSTSCRTPARCSPSNTASPATASRRCRSPATPRRASATRPVRRSSRRTAPRPGRPSCGRSTPMAPTAATAGCARTPGYRSTAR